MSKLMEKLNITPDATAEEKPTFTPTPEQLAIVEAAKSSEDNLLVRALAGAAKTSTLILIAEALKNKSILCLAFNKAIQLEMTDRLPTNAVALTLNGLGHRTWATFLGKRLRLDKSKTYKLVKAYIEEELSRNEQEVAYEMMSDLIRMVDSGKSAGYVPSGEFERAAGLMDDDEFFAWLDEIPTPLTERILRDVSARSIEMGLRGEIDFGDQILLPTVFPAKFIQYPIVLVDETQDLSSLNHAMLSKIAKKRLIAVGDPCQAIYGFRGAHQESMDLLRKQFNMKELVLTVSFRCPRAVVEEAQWRAPDMRYPEWAKPGAIERPVEWSIEDIPDNAAIICRNNAPLFTLGMKFLREGRYPQIRGNEIGKSLVKIMKKFGSTDLKQSDVLTHIDNWRKKKSLTYRNPSKAHDMADCMEIFAYQGPALGDAITYAEHLINSSGPVHLMTGHKSKGLEFDDVFFLDEQLLNLEGDGQDRNLKYVIQTRAMERLIYVKTADFVCEEGDE